MASSHSKEYIIGWLGAAWGAIAFAKTAYEYSSFAVEHKSFLLSLLEHVGRTAWGAILIGLLLAYPVNIVRKIFSGYDDGIMFSYIIAALCAGIYFDVRMLLGYDSYEPPSHADAIFFYTLGVAAISGLLLLFVYIKRALEGE